MNTTIKLGDSFALGTHRLLCGDSRDAAMMKHFLQDESIHLVLTDPPYGVDYVQGKAAFVKSAKRHADIVNDHAQSEGEYCTFTRQWIDAVRPHLARKNALYIFNADKMVFALREGLEASNCHFGQLLIWIKNKAVVGQLDYLPQHELILYGWSGVHAFYKAKDKSVLLYPRPVKNTLHPTMKPVGLLRRLILNSSRRGDTIYDPFLGSGSTLMAAEQTKRRCIGVEIDPHYCQVVIDRFERLTGTAAKELSPSHHE